MELLHIMCTGVHYLHVRCQSGERLSPTSPNTQEKSIPRSLPQDPADSADVLYCIHEKHKLQLRTVRLIVLLQIILNHYLQLWAQTGIVATGSKQVRGGGWGVVCKHSQATAGGRAWCSAGSGSSCLSQLLPRSCSWGGDRSLCSILLQELAGDWAERS